MVAARAGEMSREFGTIFRRAQVGEGLGAADRRRRHRVVIVGTDGPSGGISVDPGVTFAYALRRKLKPLRIAPAILYDRGGRRIGEIRVDPVTGARTRVMDS